MHNQLGFPKAKQHWQHLYFITFPHRKITQCRLRKNSQMQISGYTTRVIKMRALHFFKNFSKCCGITRQSMNLHTLYKSLKSRIRRNACSPRIKKHEMMIEINFSSFYGPRDEFQSVSHLLFLSSLLVIPFWLSANTKFVFS